MIHTHTAAPHIRTSPHIHAHVTNTSPTSPDPPPTHPPIPSSLWMLVHIYLLFYVNRTSLMDHVYMHACVRACMHTACTHVQSSLAMAVWQGGRLQTSRPPETHTIRSTVTWLQVVMYNYNTQPLPAAASSQGPWAWGPVTTDYVLGRHQICQVGFSCGRLPPVFNLILRSARR